MSYRVGMDLADCEELRASLEAHGDRFLERVYTAAERDDCARDPRRLAEVFAAKEAVMKALDAEERPPWTSIAVRRDAAGRPTLQLTGAAAELAAERRAGEISLSLARAGSHVAAVALARTA